MSVLPGAAARPVLLRAAERARLKRMAYGHKTEYRLRMRAQVVLHAARGRSNAGIARETGLHLDTVRTWRGRFARHGLPGLSDRRRSGRPPRFTTLQTAQVKALACIGAGTERCTTSWPRGISTCPGFGWRWPDCGCRAERTIALDVTPWPRPDAECSPERLHCHRPCRCDGVRQTIPGWPYQVAAALGGGRSSWTGPLDAVRL
ncbi:helix-turn-helix domain-containing protein, partial [Streptomyces mirabilis]|uniref:helix-turn-helix domain-containing protein n=1 Tax=Streptomyces mirabilis TaxID=68239 RepID=UPI0037B10B06